MTILKTELELGTYTDDLHKKSARVEICLCNKDLSNDEQIVFASDGSQIIDENQLTNFKELHLKFYLYDTFSGNVDFSIRGGMEGENYSCYKEIFGYAFQSNAFEQHGFPNIFEALSQIGQDFHENSIRYGTFAQEVLVKQWVKDGNHYDYSGACIMLEKKNMLNDVNFDYRYGVNISSREIPENIILLLENIIHLSNNNDMEGLRALDDELSKDLDFLLNYRTYQTYLESNSHKKNKLTLK